MAESARLAKALEEEDVFVRHVVLNQILDFAAAEAEAAGGDSSSKVSADEAAARIRRFVESRMKDQQAALARLKSDPATANLELFEGPVINMEVRGVPALQYFASIIWSS